VAGVSQESESAAGWGIGRSVIAADCGVKSPFIRVAATRAAPPAVIAGHYTTSNYCKPLLVTFPVSGGI